MKQRMKLGPFLLAVGTFLTCNGTTQAADLGGFSLERDTWQFHNFKDPELGWDLYRRSFFGVPSDPVSAPFDALYYDMAYKTIADGGNCYGMCVLILKLFLRQGCPGFCPPSAQYSGDWTGSDGPTDDMLRTTINEVHGHQLDLPSVEFILSLVAQGRMRDGSYAFDQFNYYTGKGDPVVISITKSLAPGDDGHTMLPYRSEDNGGGDRRIYVYDPNHSYFGDPNWYGSGTNYIAITGSGGWSFTMAGGEVWQGSPQSGGNIFVCPFSVAGPTARTPTSYGDPANLVTQIFISGAQANLVQIVDTAGKRLFLPGTYEVDIDPSTGMRNTFPQIRFDQSGSSGDMKVFIMRGKPPHRIDLDIQGGADGYRLGVLGRDSYAEVRAQLATGRDVVSLLEPGTERPELVVYNGAGAVGYDISLRTPSRDRKIMRTLEVRKLRIDATEKPAVVGLSESRDALEITSGDAGLKYDVALSQDEGGRHTESLSTGLEQKSNRAATVSPRSWNRLRAGDILTRTDSARVVLPKLKPMIIR